MAGSTVIQRVGKGLVDLLDFSGVPGKPAKVKIPGRGEASAAPIKEIDEAAETYMKKAGIPGTHRIEKYPEFDTDFARRTAEWYDKAKHAPTDPEVKKAYDRLIEETVEQYKALEGTGIDVRFLKEGMDDPYAKSPAMGYADIVDNGRLWVFPTDFGFGSSAAFDPSENPLLKKVGKIGDKRDAVANDAFRVVHDAYGHFGPGNPFFRHQGEDRAWQHHARMFTDEALPAMTSETRGQNSWLNFGPHAEKNRTALGADTVFADQKSTLAPDWVIERELGRRLKKADGGRIAHSPDDIESMTHDTSYGYGMSDGILETMGEQVNMGPTPTYYREDGERYAPAEHGRQLLHDAARMGVYAVPAVGPAVGATLDTAEAINTGNPLDMGLAVVAGPGGKKVKGALTAAIAATADPADAEAGMFGHVAKWALSSAGKDALHEAIKMEAEKASPETIREATNWFRDLDGSWKYELPSKGAEVDYKNLSKKNKVGDVFHDPHLFEEYPDLAGMQFRRMNERGAKFDPRNKEIVLGDWSSPSFNTPESGGVPGIMAHELYHAKANIEGWDGGTNLGAARHDINRDLSQMSGNSDPDVQNTYKVLSMMLADDYVSSPLTFGRYEADMGEALARREAKRRGVDENTMWDIPPRNDIDMPREALFREDRRGTPDQYRALIAHVRATMEADAKAAAEARKAKKK